MESSCALSGPGRVFEETTLAHAPPARGVVLRMTVRSPLAVLSLLLVSCSGGPVARQGVGDPDPAAEPFEEVPAERTASESHQAALRNAPTTHAVPDVPLELACDGAVVGKVLHRLNRLEYDNTVRDLLGDTSAPARRFPPDDFSDSFDNNAAALTVSPLLADEYLAAARAVSQQVFEGPARERVVTCRPDADGADNCAREILTAFLRRAYRRPLLDEELDTYVALTRAIRDVGGSFDQALAGAIEAALSSVHFLYRVELDPEPSYEGSHALSPYETASRLSYFLWSSMPDDELFDAAEQGDLQTAEGVRKQVRRMLADDKANALLDAFAGRWLEFDDIARSNEPSMDLFPSYTPELKASMEAETRAFVRDVLLGETSFHELLTANYSYLDARLAAHYDVEGDFSDEPTWVDLTGTQRGGLLRQASVLTATAVPTRTSPVRRGVYVLTNLLCSPPPPPPPAVQGDLDAEDNGVPSDLPQSDRTRLHTTDPECVACHQVMDPIGFALEAFDAVGALRTQENGAPLDLSGTLIRQGEEVDFDGPGELAALLAEDERLLDCAVRKLYAFALGRLPSSTGEDDCRLERLRDTLVASGGDFSELITSMTLTDAFRARRALEEESP